VSYGGQCLYGTQTLMTAFVAHEFCVGLGGRLPEPKGLYMDDILAKFANSYILASPFWLGYNDINVEGR
jgi:hypothetical protein